MASELTFLTLLAECPAQLLKELYEHAPVVFSVYRAVGPVARHLLARLQSQPLREQSILLFGRNKEQAKQLESARDELLQLKIVTRVSSVVEGQQLVYLAVSVNFKETLGRVFREGLDQILPRTGKQRSEQREWWPGFIKLYQMISDPAISGGRALQSRNMREVLRKSKLVPESSREISSKGFQFILSNTKHQVNRLVYYYCRQLLLHSAHRVRLLAFLLGLSLLSPGLAYRPQLVRKELLPEEADILADLAEIGFCWRQGQLVGVTELFANFCFEEPKAKLDMQCDIIVETNFRVYAQLRESVDAGSRFMRELLRKFIEVEEYQFQNMIVGTITEEQIKRAFRKGISADSIVEFFRQNTSATRLRRLDQGTRSPDFERKGRLHFLKLDQQDDEGGIPTNVSQQIKLWEEVEWEGRMELEEYSGQASR